MKRKEWLERFLFVRKCGGCQEILPYERSSDTFCPVCERRWRIAKAETCSECFRIAPECTCAPKGLRNVRSLRKIFFYHTKHQKEAQNRLVYSLKHRPNKRYSDFIAGELSSAIEEELRACGFDGKRDEVVLVNVPRSRRSKILYGHDQSELICRALARRCSICYLPCIRRRRDGKEQKKLTGGKRFGNVSGAFALRRGTDLTGKCVILFDDIVTTGASMSGCASLLKMSGAKEISAFCIARG